MSPIIAKAFGKQTSLSPKVPGFEKEREREDHCDKCQYDECLQAPKAILDALHRLYMYVFARWSLFYMSAFILIKFLFVESIVVHVIDIFSGFVPAAFRGIGLIFFF